MNTIFFSVGTTAASKRSIYVICSRVTVVLTLAKLAEGVLSPKLMSTKKYVCDKYCKKIFLPNMYQVQNVNFITENARYKFSLILKLYILNKHGTLKKFVSNEVWMQASNFYNSVRKQFVSPHDRLTFSKPECLSAFGQNKIQLVCFSPKLKPNREIGLFANV